MFGRHIQPHSIQKGSGKCYNEYCFIVCFPTVYLLTLNSLAVPSFLISRDVRRYDDVDFVQGDDLIEGGSGNDVLHGQRGNDVIHGDDGDDELYGELGSDRLDGGEGDDILLGDVGYSIRRYSHVDPIHKTISSSGRMVWHKDIILEELGNITSTTRISMKVNPQTMRAEAIAEADLVFVASAYENGNKFIDSGGEWPTDMFTFNLQEEYDDYLSGGSGKIW